MNTLFGLPFHTGYLSKEMKFQIWLYKHPSSIWLIFETEHVWYIWRDSHLCCTSEGTVTIYMVHLKGQSLFVWYIWRDSHYLCGTTEGTVPVIMYNIILKKSVSIFCNFCIMYNQAILQRVESTIFNQRPSVVCYTCAWEIWIKNQASCGWY